MYARIWEVNQIVSDSELILNSASALSHRAPLSEGFHKNLALSLFIRTAKESATEAVTGSGVGAGVQATTQKTQVRLRAESLLRGEMP